jgi:hypothetical protein
MREGKEGERKGQGRIDERKRRNGKVVPIYRNALAKRIIT